MSDRSRNLNVLRLILAVLVIVSHAWPLALGPAATEPLEGLTGRSLGGWAVGVFFFISGMLITASAEGKSAIPFWLARIRRILPGLGAALFVTLALAEFSGSSAHIKQSAFWFFRAITLVSIEHRLPDAFATNPYPLVVNGPLWSLFYEVVAYAICAGFVWIGGGQSRVAVVMLLGVGLLLAMSHELLPARLATFAPLFLAFALGQAAYIFRHQISPNLVKAIAFLLLAAALPWSVALGVAGFGLVLFALVLPGMHLRHDASYGLYIYGWPIAQTVVVISPGIEPLSLACWTLICTYPVALASWSFIEKPVLHFGKVAA